MAINFASSCSRSTNSMHETCLSKQSPAYVSACIRNRRFSPLISLNMAGHPDSSAEQVSCGSISACVMKELNIIRLLGKDQYNVRNSSLNPTAYGPAGLDPSPPSSAPVPPARCFWVTAMVKVHIFDRFSPLVRMPACTCILYT